MSDQKDKLQKFIKKYYQKEEKNIEQIKQRIEKEKEGRQFIDRAVYYLFQIQEELREIIDLLNCPERIGICLDTCHVHDAGYDIINDLDGVLGEFDRIIGLERLKAIHLNDSKNVCGSHKDRHERLGEGCIGNEALMRIVTHPLLHDLPFFLETPNDSEGYKKEISTVRTWRTDTVKADGVQTDTVKAECVQTDIVKAGGVQTDTVKADCVQTDTVKAECVQTDIVKTGGAKTEKLRGTIL